MKFVFAVLLCITLQCQSYSQNIKKDSVINANDLTGIKWQRWYSIDSLWLKYFFPSCLEENELKLSCGTCESIYLDVQLTIDATGKLVSFKRVKGKICDGGMTDELEKCFLDYFLFMEFPVELRNMTIEVKLGDGLKC